eukprot:1142210-Pelagomonas_calceolata.AAC.4
MQCLRRLVFPGLHLQQQFPPPLLPIVSGPCPFNRRSQGIPAPSMTRGAVCKQSLTGECRKHTCAQHDQGSSVRAKLDRCLQSRPATNMTGACTYMSACSYRCARSGMSASSYR